MALALNPFTYDLHLTKKTGRDSKTLIVAHGLGGDSQIIKTINSPKTLVSFNFPQNNSEIYGTINEILPLIYVIKKSVIEEGQHEIDLYGYSAGGAAVINALAILNTNRFDEDLKKIEVGLKEKKILLEAIQKGMVILDSPLKSIQEIIDTHGNNDNLQKAQKRYQDNDLVPIEALKYLEGLALNIIISFQNPDEVLSNRDDELFISRLKKYNVKGITKVIRGGSGHHLPHDLLWMQLYKSF